jgi:hypothetical protein
MEYMDRYLDDELEQWMNVIGAVIHMLLMRPMSL